MPPPKTPFELFASKESTFKDFNRGTSVVRNLHNGHATDINVLIWNSTEIEFLANEISHMRRIIIESAPVERLNLSRSQTSFKVQTLNRSWFNYDYIHSIGTSKGLW